MSLNADNISAEQVESTSKTILAEWLAAYFDGGNHTVSGKTSAYPVAEVEFDQGPTKEPPSSKVLLRVRSLSLREEMTDTEEGRRKYDHVRMLFVPKASGEKARERAQKVAELLHWLLSNPNATVDLAEKGIFDITVQKPEPLPSADHYQYLVQAKMTLQYDIAFRA